MKTRRLVTLLTLLAFLPVAAGCSKTLSFEVDSDPSRSDVAAELQAGEPVRIAGYTLASDEHIDWDGHVRLTTPESLEFAPEPDDGVTTASFVLSAEEVTSIDAVRPDRVATVFVVTLALAVTAFLTAAAIVGAGAGPGL